jgi:hypothetical protein
MQVETFHVVVVTIIIIICPFACGYINIDLWTVELLKIELLLLIFNVIITYYS